MMGKEGARKKEDYEMRRLPQSCGLLVSLISRWPANSEVYCPKGCGDEAETDPAGPG